jgi:hypothetical protein
MKQRIVLMALLLVCTMAGTAQAALTTFSETLLGGIGDGTTQRVTSKIPASFQFDLTKYGYSAADYTITTATLSYTLHDTDRAKDSALLKTSAGDGGLTIGDYFKVANRLDLKKNQTSQSFAYSFSAANLAFLSDGLLGLGITSANNIYIDQLRLDVTAEANPVPLPSAAWFLGTSLIGVVAIRRRMTI